MIEIFWIDRLAMVIAMVSFAHQRDVHEYLRAAEVAMLVGIDRPTEIDHSITDNREPQAGSVWFRCLAGKPDIPFRYSLDTRAAVGHGKREGIILNRCRDPQHPVLRSIDLEG